MHAGNRGNGQVVAELDSYPSALIEQSRRGLRRSVQSAPLIGREAELAAVLRLVADPAVRLVSLVGRGGVGKTRLALEVAWTLDAGQPGSVGVVSLASVPAPLLVAAEIADQLQITIPPGLSAVDAVARRLQGAPPTALVLDNFEHLLAGAGVLTDLLDACDQLQLIVTSQAPLRLRPERVVPLSPLPVPAEGVRDLRQVAAQPAVALYCDRAKAASDQFRLELANVARSGIAMPRTGGTAARDRACGCARRQPAGSGDPGTPPQRRLDVLRASKPDSPARHQDIRAAIDWTYRLLPVAGRDLLRRLSVAGAAFEIEDAEVLAANRVSRRSRCAVLAGRRALAQPVPADGYTRFELPPSVRDFASEQLKASVTLLRSENLWLTLAGRARPRRGLGPDRS